MVQASRHVVMPVCQNQLVAFNLLDVEVLLGNPSGFPDSSITN